MTRALPYIDAATLAETVSMADAISAVRTCFAARPSHVDRLQMAAGSAEMLLMPAASGTSAGVKLVTIQPANPAVGRPMIQALYVLFDTETGEATALFDGTALTTLRTPAVSAIATDALAIVEARSLGIIGTGPQASAHVEAMRCVRPGVDTVVIAGRTREHVERVVGEAALFGVSARVGTYAEAAACDIVCTLTRSGEPLFSATDVVAGAHLNLVGSYRPGMIEVGADVLNAATVYVDDVAAAHHEAGEMIAAAAAGTWSWDAVRGDLADLAGGVELADDGLRRRGAAEITLFKSSGLAVQDLAVVHAAARALNFA